MDRTDADLRVASKDDDDEATTETSGGGQTVPVTAAVGVAEAAAAAAASKVGEVGAGGRGVGGGAGVKRPLVDARDVFRRGGPKATRVDPYLQQQQRRGGNGDGDDDDAATMAVRDAGGTMVDDADGVDAARAARGERRLGHGTLTDEPRNRQQQPPPHRGAGGGGVDEANAIAKADENARRHPSATHAAPHAAAVAAVAARAADGLGGLPTTTAHHHPDDDNGSLSQHPRLADKLRALCHAWSSPMARGYTSRHRTSRTHLTHGLRVWLVST